MQGVMHMAKNKDFPMEHYKQLLEQNKQLTGEKKKLQEDLSEKDEIILGKDTFIFEQNCRLINVMNNIDKLTETGEDAQSKGASILKKFSDTFKEVFGSQAESNNE